MPYELPKLSYAFDALEPHIDTRTMQIHYAKHHKTYVDKLNAAIETAGYDAPSCVRCLISNLDAVPASIRTAVRNNGGGHANHSLFWDILDPKGGGAPNRALGEAISKDFKSFKEFKEQFTQIAINHFGSGWAWLYYSDGDRKLHVCSTPNQDNPLMADVVDCPGKPIIGLDLWEHAYYLNYQNLRPEYIAAFWEVVNWQRASALYEKAKA